MKRNRPRTLLLLGISGSGKGTQALRLLRAIKPSHHVEPGKWVRYFMNKNTVGGLVIKKYSQRGDLVPTWVLLAILAHELMERVPSGVHIIGDGTPRRRNEAKLWDDIMRDAGHSLPQAIHITLSEKEALARLRKRGRVDDTSRAIRRRFKFFRRDVLPVVDYYRRRGRLRTINGDQAVHKVWGDLKKAVGLK